MTCHIHPTPIQSGRSPQGSFDRGTQQSKRVLGTLYHRVLLHE